MTAINLTEAFLVFSASIPSTKECDLRDARKRMYDANLIEPRYNSAGTVDGWQITEKGVAWINAALLIPMPIQAYVIPATNGGSHV